MHLYNIWSTSFDESSKLNLEPIIMGLRTGLQSSIWIFEHFLDVLGLIYEYSISY